MPTSRTTKNVDIDIVKVFGRAFAAGFRFRTVLRSIIALLSKTFVAIPATPHTLWLSQLLSSKRSR
jgi:hypothetical protein